MTMVQDVVIRESSVIVATAGRGIWRLDDVSALRQLTGDITRAQAYLFRPAPAWRMRAQASRPDLSVLTPVVTEPGKAVVALKWAVHPLRAGSCSRSSRP